MIDTVGRFYIERERELYTLLAQDGRGDGAYSVILYYGRVAPGDGLGDVAHEFDTDGTRFSAQQTFALLVGDGASLLRRMLDNDELGEREANMNAGEDEDFVSEA